MNDGLYCLTNDFRDLDPPFYKKTPGAQPLGSVRGRRPASRLVHASTSLGHP